MLAARDGFITLKDGAEVAQSTDLHAVLGKVLQVGLAALFSVAAALLAGGCWLSDVVDLLLLLEAREVVELGMARDTHDERH